MSEIPPVSYSRRELSILANVGLRRMRDSTVVICCMARNVLPALRRHRAALETLAGLFKQSRIVVVESDSTDGTKEFLSQWAQENRSVQIVTHDTHEPVLPVEIPQGVNPSLSRRRMDRMTRCRNLYLDAASAGEKPDYLIVLDVDVEQFFLRGIAQSFGLDQPWDALFANGRCYSAKRWTGFFFDTYPFRLRNDASPATLETMRKRHKIYGHLRPGDPLVPVDSAFGGLGIYRYQAVEGLRYRTIINAGGDPQVEVLCDHESLHAEMRMRRYTNLFVNPALRVIYQSLAGHYRQKMENSLRKRLNPQRFREHAIADLKKWRRSIRKRFLM